MFKFFYLFVSLLFWGNNVFANDVVLSNENTPEEVFVREIKREIIELPLCSDSKLIEQAKNTIIDYYEKTQLSNISDRRRKHFILDNINNYSPENIENYKSEKARPVSDIIVDLKINKSVLEENMRLCKNLSKNKQASDVYLLIFADDTNTKVKIINLKKKQSIDDDISFIYE